MSARAQWRQVEQRGRDLGGLTVVQWRMARILFNLRGVESALEFVEAVVEDQEPIAINVFVFDGPGQLRVCWFGARIPGSRHARGRWKLESPDEEIALSAWPTPGRGSTPQVEVSGSFFGELTTGVAVAAPNCLVVTVMYADLPEPRPTFEDWP